MGFVDSHAHLTSDALYPEVDALIARALQSGVSAIVNINTDRTTWERAVLLKKQYPKVVFNTVATTPHDVEEEGEANFAYFEEIIRKGEVVAIGEVGLDYYYEHAKREVQKEFLRRYFALALDTNLPVVIHCRGDEAFLDLFQYKEDLCCLLHCFTGNLKQAEEALERGWYISISGIATFKKSEALRSVIENLPLERLLIETDAPYLAPESKRGRVNEPSYIRETAEVIAKVKGLPLEEVLARTKKNACTFFAL